MVLHKKILIYLLLKHRNKIDFLFLKVCVCFWLHRVFAAALRLSLVAGRGGYSPDSGGFSRCRAQAPGMQARELQLMDSLNLALWLSCPEADGIFQEWESKLWAFHWHMYF